ncbi:MAG: GNAT family N-acetyltransferase [Candidatus Fimivivens sp.]|nr:GNAT family N-acetyltransferase [Candidatus Fimivivens sp.]
METIERFKSYSGIRLMDIECDKPYIWNATNATNVRVVMPSSNENMCAMIEKGFYPADRVLDVTINLSRSKLDFGKMIRTEPIIINNRRDEIFDIAKESFPFDRRFHLEVKYNNAVAEKVIRGWVDDLEEYYVCMHQDQCMGFLSLTKMEDAAFVHLAAVRQKYRLSGAALSLYAAAARDCKKLGINMLNGRISTLNTAVINLYSFLGGNFSNPMDVFLKEM